MTTALIVLAVAAVVLILVWWGGRQAKNAGRDQERSETQERVIENVDRKNRLAGELDSADARERLRKKHYRD